MKIALVGPGIISIPPPGWGAVEILIWDYYSELKKLGHEVDIINIIRSNSFEQTVHSSPYTIRLIQTINSKPYDFVHIHYDCLFHIMPYLNCKKVAITSHYPYIDQTEKHMYDGYSRVFHFLVQQKQYYNFVLAEKDYAAFLKHGADPVFLKKMKNGINCSLFHFEKQAKLNKSIYLGKITPRKKQAKYQSLCNIDFVGNCSDGNFNVSAQNYLGEWSRPKIHQELTNYSNLVLLSEGEADPLVVKEAFIAGLGVVINKTSAANLDTSLGFITVIPDDLLDDLEYIQSKIEENKQISNRMREYIHTYGISKYDISNEVQDYLHILLNL